MPDLASYHTGMTAATLGYFLGVLSSSGNPHSRHRHKQLPNAALTAWRCHSSVVCMHMPDLALYHTGMTAATNGYVLGVLSSYAVHTADTDTSSCRVQRCQRAAPKGQSFAYICLTYCCINATELNMAAANLGSFPSLSQPQISWCSVCLKWHWLTMYS